MGLVDDQTHGLTHVVGLHAGEYGTIYKDFSALSKESQTQVVGINYEYANSL